MSGLATFPAGAPERLAEDLQGLVDLPAPAQQDLWTLVEPNIGAVVGDAAEDAARRFCEAHDLTLEQLVPLVRGLRKLLRQAAAFDLPVERVHDDVVILLGNRDAARRAAACYAKALVPLRAEAVLSSVERFGPVLIDFGLRMDHVSLSRNSPDKAVPIALLSLPYREGGESKRLTLQVTPALLRKMKAMLDAAIG